MNRLTIGVEHLQTEILQDIRRMRGHDDENTGNKSRNSDDKDIPPSRSTAEADKSVSRTKAFQRRYVHLQRELQLPLKKLQRSRSPRIPETSRSAPTGRDDAYNDNEGHHASKEEVQKILTRLRKQRER